MTSLWRCTGCGTIERTGLTDDDLERHRGEVGYTDLSRSDILFQRRKEWFLDFRDRLELRLPEDRRRLLDIGCSYGHMIRLFANAGWTVQGLEPDGKCVDYARESGLNVVLGTFPETSLDARQDVVTFIDSFYYLLVRPVDALTATLKLLESDGVLFMRLTNRTHLVRAYAAYARMTGKPLVVPDPIIGDALVSYSPRGIRHLLTAAGFTDVEIQGETGKGKSEVPGIRKALYSALHAIDLLTLGRVVLSPGFLVWAKNHDWPQKD